MSQGPLGRTASLVAGDVREMLPTPDKTTMPASVTDPEGTVLSICQWVEQKRPPFLPGLLNGTAVALAPKAVRSQSTARVGKKPLLFKPWTSGVLLVSPEQS